MGDDKVIRISAAADENSFRSLTTHIRDAAREVEKLGDALGSLGRGGRSPVAVTGMGGDVAPAGFAGAQASMRAGGIGQTLAQGVGAVGPAMQRAASDARTGARALGDSLRDAAAAGEPQVRRLQNAVEALAAAMRQVKDMSGSSGGQRFLPGLGPPPGTSGEQVQIPLRGLPDRTGRTLFGQGPQVVQVAGQGPSSTPVHLATPLALGDMTAEEFAAVSPGRALMQRMGGALTQERHAPRAITDLIPAGLRGTAARYGLAAGAAYGAYKVYDWMTQATANINVANAEETVQNREWYGVNLRAAAGQTFGGAGVGILGGDMATARAMRLALRDPAQQRLMGLDMTQRRLGLAAHQQGLPSFVDPMTGESMTSASGFTVGNIKTTLGNKKDQLITEVSNSWGDVLLKGISKGVSAMGRVEDVLEAGVSRVFGVDFSRSAAARTADVTRLAGDRADEGTLTKQQIGMRRAEAGLPIQQMEELRRRTEAYKAADPMFGFISQGLMGGAQGTMDMLRSAGLGQREVREKQFGNVIGYSGDRWLADMTSKGLVAQALQARQTIQATGGRGLMGHGDALASMMAGGLGSAPQLFGLSAQLGGGYQGRGLPPLLQAVQGAIGRGGLDVTAGAGLGETVGGLLRQGHMGLGGAEAFEAIAGAAYTPALPGENRAARDVRAAQAMSGGLQQLGEQMGGGIDPLGQALTRRAALRVAGDRGPYVADAMERLMKNPAEFAQILKSGRVPRGLAALGITAKDLQRLQQEQNLQNTVRTVQRGLPAGEAGDFAKRLIGARGDVAGAVTGLIDERLGAGYSDRLRALRRTAPGSSRLARMEREAMGAYRPGLEGYAEIEASNTGERRSPEDVVAKLELEAGLGGFGRRVKGAGAHDTIGSEALEKKAAEARGSLERQTSQEKYNQSEKFKETAAGASVQAAALEAANQKVQGAAGNATQLAAVEQHLMVGIDKVAIALTGLAQRINSTVPRR